MVYELMFFHFGRNSNCILQRILLYKFLNKNCKLYILKNIYFQLNNFYKKNCLVCCPNSIK